MSDFQPLISPFRLRMSNVCSRVLRFEFRFFDFRRSLVAGLLVLGWLIPRSAAAQQGNVMLEANEQLFCVLAALNSAGYDAGLSEDGGNSTRREVRALLAKRNIPILPELRKFYADHRVADDAGSDLGQYISLALLLGPPPEFRPTVPQSDLPPDAKRLVGLIPLLRSFYNQAGLLELWAQLQARYQGAVESYSEAVRRSVVQSDGYLRFPSGSYLGRTYTIYLSLLAAPEQVHARIYGANYYLVVAPSKEPKLNEIRHQYLHFLLDPLAVKYAPEIHQKIELAAVARPAESLGSDFKEDFPLLVTECLIRAAELRMDKRSKAETEKVVQGLTASGLILAPYFNQALADFEQQDASMNVFYKPMILGINPREERNRLASVKFSPRAAPASKQASPALSEEERLLNQADNLIAEGHYSEAKTAFQTIEKSNPRNERALFGLAVVASNTRKPDLAEEYFRKTLDSARDLRLVTWSHIYLGRLYDLQGKRVEALGHYRAASLTASTYPEALRAVQNGLSRPYGSKD